MYCGNVVGGDEWSANPPWKKTAEKMVPTEFTKKAVDSSKPETSLRLNWVHG